MTKPLIILLIPTPKLLHRPISSSVEPTTVPLLGESQDSVSELFSPNAHQITSQGGGGQPLARPSSLRMLLTKPSHTVHYYWRKFDNAFMRPVFGGRGFVPYVPGSPTERSVHNWQEEDEEPKR